MTPPKDTKKAPVTDHKEMEIHDLLDEEFKIIILKKFSELQEDTDRQLNEIRKTIYEQNEKFNKEIETIKKNQTEPAQWHSG